MKKVWVWAFVVVSAISASVTWGGEKDSKRELIPAKSEGRKVETGVMERVYEAVKTPYKYGIIIRPEEGKKVDCPSVFRYGEKWYMVYIIFDGRGYETAIAESEDLLKWKTLGKILPYSKNSWDENQGAGYIALQDYRWGGSYELERYEGKYWLSYIGGASTGYEAGRLGIGMAWTKQPPKGEPWQRIKENPVLSDEQEDARWWEHGKLYKSHVIHDKEKTLGYPYIMYYNARDKKGVERIGMAVSKDMRDWRRYGKDPVIDNQKGISGDPQITKIGDVWVMFYFGAFWKPKAFDTFACSYDLVHWTKWEGPDLIRPTEPWEKTYAHKPWVILNKGTVYHFYCAVGDQGRTIAVATSKKLNSP